MLLTTNVLLLSLLQVEELERVKVELERERKYTAELLEQVSVCDHEYTTQSSFSCGFCGVVTRCARILNNSFTKKDQVQTEHSRCAIHIYYIYRERDDYII